MACIITYEGKEYNFTEFTSLLTTGGVLAQAIKDGKLNEPWTNDLVAAAAPQSGVELEAKKADIERKREEELEKYKKLINKLYVWTGTAWGSMIQKEKASNSVTFISEDEGKRFTLPLSNEFSDDITRFLIESKKTKNKKTVGENFRKSELPNKIYRQINAIYDAELAALESTPQKQEAPEAGSEPTNEAEETDLDDFFGFKPSAISSTTEVVSNSAEEIKAIESVLGKDAIVKLYQDESELLGDLPTAAKLIHQIKSKGEILEGLFTEAAIYIRNNGSQGRGFHEAFHAVFTLGLSNLQQKQVIQSARLRYKDNVSTDLQIEEKLAEEFRAVMLNNGAVSNFSNTLKKILYTLKDLINHFFNIHSPLNVNRLFFNIKAGKYKDKISFKRNFKVFKAMSTTGNVGRTEAEIKDYLGYYNHLYSELITEIKGFPGTEGMSDISALRKAAANYRDGDAVVYLNDKILGKLLSKYKEAHASGDLRLKENISNMINTYFPKSTITADKAKQTLTTIPKKVSPNLVQAMFSLSSKGVKINPAVGEFVQETQERDLEAALENVQDFERDNFSRNRIEEDSRNKVKDTIKRALFTLPITVDGIQQNNQRFGYPLYVNGDAVFSILEDRITNSTSESNMKDKLKELAGNYFWGPDLLKILDNPEFSAELYRAIGSQQFINFFGVAKDGATYHSNRRTLITIVSEDFASNFTNELNPLFKPSTFEIDTEKGKKLLEDFDSILLPVLDNKQNFDFKEGNLDMTNIFSSLSNLLGTNGIPITVDQFKGLYNNDPNTFVAHIRKIRPLIVAIQEGNNPFEGLLTNSNTSKGILREFARTLQIVSEVNAQSSFMGGNNKPKFAVSEPNYISDLANLIILNPEAFVESFGVGSLKMLPFLKSLKNKEVANKFATFMLENAATEQGKEGYMDMEESDLLLSKMNAFFNNKFAEGYALMATPTPADSKTLNYFQVPKLGINEVVHSMYELALMEQYRINKFKNSEELKKIKNVEKRTQFIHLPFLNNVNYAITKENKIKIKNDITNYLDSRYEEFVKRLQDYNSKELKGKILDTRDIWDSKFEKTKNENGKFSYKETALGEAKTFLKDPKRTGSFLKHPTKGKFLISQDGSLKPMSKEGTLDVENKIEIDSITDLASLAGYKFIPTKELAKDYFYNEYYYNTQFIELIHKSPSFYKHVVDAMKRYKQGNGAGQVGNKSIPVRALVKNDVLVKNTSELTAALKKHGKKDKYTQKGIDNAENNATDGATFFSLRSARDYMENIGKWEGKEAIYQIYLKEAKAWKPGQPFKSKLTFDQRKDLFKAFKPFSFTERIVDGEVVPLQIKNSVQILTPEYIVLSGNNPEGALAEAWTDLEVNVEGTNSPKTDIILYESAIKVGGLPEGEMMELDLKDFRWAQETVPHWFNHYVRQGSQMRIISPNNINLKGEYNTAGTTLLGEDLKKVIADITEANLIEDSSKLDEIIFSPENEYARLREELTAISLLRDVPAANINVFNRTINVNGVNIPKLFGIGTAKNAASMISSLYKNKVWSQKLPGGQLINKAGIGVSDELKVIINEETNTLEFEAYVPAWTKELSNLPRLENGTLDISKVDPKVLEVLGFRMPTEGKYSIIAIRIKGLLPAEEAGNIVLPANITEVTGLDFDIDKMFVYLPNHAATYTDTEQSTIDKIEYISYNYNSDVASQDRKARENGLIAAYRAISSNLKEHGEESLGHAQFDEFKNLAYSIYLKKNDSSFKNSDFSQLLNMSIEEKSKKILTLEESKYNLADPITQLEFYGRNKLGKALTGIQANQRVNQIKAKDTNLKLKEAIQIGSFTLESLNSKENEMLIDYVLEQLSAAVVDNAKDPLAPFVNFNTVTADAYNAGIRLGLSLDYMIVLMTTPLAEKLSKRALKSGTSFEIEAANELSNLKNIESSEETDSLTTLKIEELFNNEFQAPLVYNNLNSEQRVNKIKLLNTYIKLGNIGAELSTVIRGTKSDSAAASNTIAGLTIQNKVFETIESGQFNELDNVSDFYSKDPNVGNRIVKMFKENAHNPVVESLKKFFPFFNSNIENVVEQLLSNISGKQNIQEKHISQLFDHLMTFHLNSYNSLESTTEIASFVKDVHKEFLEVKKKYATTYPNLFNALRLETVQIKGKDLEYDRLTTNRGMVSAETINEIHREWKMLMENEETSELAEDLLMYALKSFGVTSTPFGFLEIIHPEAFNSTLVNVDESFTLENHFETLLTDESLDFVNFFDQFVRNTFNDNNSFVAKKAGETPVNKDGTITIAENDSNKNYYLNKNGEFIKYVKNDGNLYKLATESGSTEAVYKQISSLGSPYYWQEYYPSEIEPVSKMHTMPNSNVKAPLPEGRIGQENRQSTEGLGLAQFEADISESLEGDVPLEGDSRDVIPIETLLLQYEKTEDLNKDNGKKTDYSSYVDAIKLIRNNQAPTFTKEGWDALTSQEQEDQIERINCNIDR